LQPISPIFPTVNKQMKLAAYSVEKKHAHSDGLLLEAVRNDKELLCASLAGK
jgi:hypothetical protein